MGGIGALLLGAALVGGLLALAFVRAYQRERRIGGR